MRAQLTLTVLFDPPFWVGVFERHDEAGYSVCRVVFGSEPREAEVYQYVLTHFARLRWSEPQPGGPPERPRVNPKRAQREAQRAAALPQLSTRAQEALKLDLASRKQVRVGRSRAEREAEAERKFELRRQKRKDKHRGH